MENEKIYLRKILLDTMDTYVRNVIGDEEAIDAWLTLGVPDESDDDMLTSIAEDTDDFIRITRIFGDILNDYDEEG